MPSLSDFLSLNAIGPAIGAIVAGFLSIYSLYIALGEKSFRPVLICLVPVILLAAFSMYFGAVQNQSSAEMKRQLDSIQALFGSQGPGNGERVLQHILGEAAQPQNMSPSQIKSLTNSIANCQCEMPKIIILKMMNSDVVSAGLYLGLARAFESNSIAVSQGRGLPPNPTDSGVLIEVDNTSSIPEFALKLHSMLELADVPSKVVRIAKSDNEDGLHIFVAPP